MFIITNSVLATENLEINSATMKLHYSGTVLPSRQIHARVEAKILRDTPLVGPLLTLALSPLTKLFEYQIQGTLAHPEVEPSYIPRIFLAPFSPLKSLRELFSSDAGPSIKTNAPPPLSPVENSK